MGGLNWNGLLTVAELLGVDDLETFDVLVHQLAALRDQHG